MSEQILLTKKGYEEIKAEYEEMIAIKRPEVAQRIKEAREHGDISENAEYDAAKNEQAELEEKIKKHEEILRKAEFIEDKKHVEGKVSEGSQIEVKVTGGEKEIVTTYTILGTTEADPLKGIISNECEVGKALLGKSQGEVVTIDVSAGQKRNYEILKIN